MEGTFNSIEQFEQVLYKTIEKAGEINLGKFMALVSSEDKDKIKELYGVEKIGSKIIEILEANSEKYVFSSKEDVNKNNWVFRIAGIDNRKKEANKEISTNRKVKNEKKLPSWVEKRLQKQAKLDAEIASAQPSDKFTSKEDFSSFIQNIISEMDTFSITVIIGKYFTISERKSFVDIFGPDVKIGEEIKKIIDKNNELEVKTKASPDFNTWIFQKKGNQEEKKEHQKDVVTKNTEQSVSEKEATKVLNKKAPKKTVKLAEEDDGLIDDTEDGTSQTSEEGEGTSLVDEKLKRMVTKDMVLINDSFYISKYLVTQELYETVMGENPSTFKDDPEPKEKQERRPVETVSYKEAVEFCEKLSKKCGFISCYNKGTYLPDTNGFRLPTESEWNFVATSENHNSFIFAGSDVPDGFAWYKNNSKMKTHQVGTKRPVLINESDEIYDLNGNVWEWVTPDSTTDKALYIGGSYEDSEDYLELGKPISKEYTDKETKNSTIGFRICVNSLK